MMTWQQIYDLYVKGCDSTGGAIEEAYVHLTNAYRAVAKQVDVPELHVPNATVSTVASQDYVEVDADVFAVDWVFNRTSNQKMYREQDGDRGRARYLETTGMPPEGSPTYWIRHGNKIWLRDTPDGVYDLVISFRIQPPEVTSADLPKHPILPAQYDMAVVKLAIAEYFDIHPPENLEGGRDTMRAESLRANAFTDMASSDDPVAEEHEDASSYVHQRGYEMGTWGR